ncbi:MAG: prepilin-type N-terminal cleavage/methylation domain-containing protein [bacterium]
MERLISNKKGQSLIELLIGMTLGAFIIGSAIGVLVLALNINVQSKSSQSATTLAREMLDSVRSVAEGKWMRLYGIPSKGGANHYHIVSSQTLTGTVSVTNGSTTVTGLSTTFNDELEQNDYIIIASNILRVASIESQTSLTLTDGYPGGNAAGIEAYRDFSIRSGEDDPIQIGGVLFTRYFIVENVNRDDCGRGNVTENAATGCSDNPADVMEDPLTQKITVIVEWKKEEGDSTNVTIQEFFTRSGNQTARFTDWEGGIRTPSSTPVTQPDILYIEMADLNAASTPGSLKLVSEGGAVGPGGPNIDSTNRWAWNDLQAWIDFYETSTVEVTDSRIIGYAAFDNTTNYIAFDCATSPNGNVCNIPLGTGNWGVDNDGSGMLFGYAWNDGIGWISFNCDQTSVGGGNNCASGGGVDYGVTIDPLTGDFSGWAWNDIIGWVSFNSKNCDGNGNGFLDVSCGGDDATTPVISYKVQTTWQGGTAVVGSLVSSTFDTGAVEGVTFSSLMWQGSLGVSSSSVRFQFASSNSLDGEGGSWNYFGPDGTSATYYYPTGPGLPVPLVSSQHTGRRYFRYKVYLARGMSGTTATVDDIIVKWNK